MVSWHRASSEAIGRAAERPSSKRNAGSVDRWPANGGLLRVQVGLHEL